MGTILTLYATECAEYSGVDYAIDPLNKHSDSLPGAAIAHLSGVDNNNTRRPAA